jgi:hypothetical protein
VQRTQEVLVRLPVALVEVERRTPSGASAAALESLGKDASARGFRLFARQRG